MTPEILFENESLIVCIKPSGITSEDCENGGMPTLLMRNGIKPFTVHRLDREVGGVMVFAKTARTAAALSEQIAKGSFRKEYAAVVSGGVEESGKFEDLLFHDRKLNKTYVVKRERKGVKKAVLSYERLGEVQYNCDTLSFVRIKLETGRTHQIRVQFAARKTPVAGDRKYGSKIAGAFALYSKKLCFIDPENGQPMQFTANLPSEFPWNLFNEL